MSPSSRYQIVEEADGAGGGADLDADDGGRE